MGTRAHTHRGHCQVCGALQAAAQGSSLLAKHGYTTRWGFFSGTCKGSEHLPFELDKSLVEESIAWAGRKAVRVQGMADEQRARTGTRGFVHHYVSATWRVGGCRVPSRYEWVEVEYQVKTISFPRPDGSLYTYEGVVGVGTLDGKPFQSKSEVYSPSYRTPESEAAKSREARAGDLEGTVRQYLNYQSSQRRRLIGWKVTKLVPVKTVNGATGTIAPVQQETTMATAKKAKKTNGKAKAKATNGERAPSKVSKAVEFMQFEVKAKGGFKKLEHGDRKAIIEKAAKKFGLAVPTCSTQYQKQVHAAA